MVGTLDSPSDLYNAVENVPAIIHAAGGGKASELQSFLKNNVITTQQLLEAASDVEEQGTAQQHQRAKLEGCPASVGQRSGFIWVDGSALRAKPDPGSLREAGLAGDEPRDRIDRFV